MAPPLVLRWLPAHGRHGWHGHLVWLAEGFGLSNWYLGFQEFKVARALAVWVLSNYLINLIGSREPSSLAWKGTRTCKPSFFPEMNKDCRQNESRVEGL